MISLFSLKVNNSDDTIVWSACGLRFEWRFEWNSPKCPINKCTKHFKSRSAAMSHFKKTHSERSALCKICKKPFYMRHIVDIKHHFRRRHPKMAIPSYFTDTSTRQTNGDGPKPVEEKKSTQNVIWFIITAFFLFNCALQWIEFKF